MKLFKYLHIFYLLVLSEEREELLPEELRRLSELRTLEAFSFFLAYRLYPATAGALLIIIF